MTKHSRDYTRFDIQPDPMQVLKRMQAWAGDALQTCVLLNSNDYGRDLYSSFPWVFAMGVHDLYEAGAKDAFDGLKKFSDTRSDWLFGYFAYDLKNQLEPLTSKNPDHWGLPPIRFFSPVILILPEAHGIRIGTVPGYGRFSDAELVAGALKQSFAADERAAPAGEQIAVTPQQASPKGEQTASVGKQAATVRQESPAADAGESQNLLIRARVDKARYLRHLKSIKDHIQAGDIYEMNYCMEFYAEQANIHPVRVYEALNRLSEAPFSCFYQHRDFYLLGSSPERFMKKLGQKLCSQPIKGTAPRGKDAAEDLHIRQALYEDAKERSENVMIVDLVRNDLSRTAVKDSVQVEELYGVYPFRQVNQMISTVSSRLHPDHHYLDAIRLAFPMGSMTGAPKFRAMQLIDQYEDTRRGLYSGSVGYITPEKNFDFNVVIRSILYDRHRKFLSFMAGSAITIGSVPEREYEECLLKARAMAQVAGGRA